MVLRNPACRIASNAAHLVKIVLVALVCLPGVGCRPTQAGDIAEKPRCQQKEVELDEKQLSYIKDSVQRLFRWDAYWTYTDQVNRASYNERINQTFSMLVFSLSHGVVVFVPRLENAVIAFGKLANGNISNPRFVRRGPAFDGTAEGDKLIAIAKALGNWREFILFTGEEIETEQHRIPLLIPEDDMKKYIERNRDSIKYCQIESEINLLPLEPLTYDPMDEKKQALLEAIVKASIGLAKTMCNRGTSVTITIPNFNVNDGGIWILLEERHGEAYTLGMNLDITNTDAPVTYIGTVEIRSSPKYGKPIGADEKIRKAAIKVLEYGIH